MLAQPPYTLPPIAFRFRALVALAGRLPMGGDRELASALFVAARLAGACVGPAALPVVARRTRAHGARHWLAALTLPAATRVALLQLTEATAGADAEAVAVALERVAAIATPLLDAPSRAELRLVSAALRGA